MVLPPGLGVQVLNYDSCEPYAQVKHGSDTYVVGRAGEQFVVEVQADAEAFRTTPMIRATLKLDGRFLNYNITLDEENDSCVFEGYKVTDEQGQERNRPFVFATPQTTPDEAQTALPPAQAGQLSVSFTHVRSGSKKSVPWKAGKEVDPSLFVKFDEGESDRAELLQQQLSVFVFPQCISARTDLLATARAVDVPCLADKKWYEQSSLSVKPGELGEIITDAFTDYNRTVARMRIYTLKLETATTLLLRKVLLHSNPAHADILRDNGLLQSPTHQPTQAVNRRLSYPGTGSSSRQCIDLTNGATHKSPGASVEASECIDLT